MSAVQLEEKGLEETGTWERYSAYGLNLDKGGPELNAHPCSSLFRLDSLNLCTSSVMVFLLTLFLFSYCPPNKMVEVVLLDVSPPCAVV